MCGATAAYETKRTKGVHFTATTVTVTSISRKVALEIYKTSFKYVGWLVGWLDFDDKQDSLIVCQMKKVENGKYLLTEPEST